MVYPEVVYDLVYAISSTRMTNPNKPLHVKPWRDGAEGGCLMGHWGWYMGIVVVFIVIIYTVTSPDLVTSVSLYVVIDYGNNGNSGNT